ncbi:hypothetical protein DFQ28_005546 [Apophysomyces sp. BC1034]|nr:hypothetical protein DFQ30_009268 [Apophysomyces sp. BC1015]KAG0193317.1 hypothetical protein DFQ28_005546 [Apophysomyces sp. BC1034]
MLVDCMQAQNALTGWHPTQFSEAEPEINKSSGTDIPNDHNPFRDPAFQNQKINSRPPAPVSLDQFHRLLLAEIPTSHNTASFQQAHMEKLPCLSNLKDAEKNGNKILQALKHPNSNPLNKKNLNTQLQDGGQKGEEAQTHEQGSMTRDTEASHYAAKVRASRLVHPPLDPRTQQACRSASLTSKPAEHKPGSTPLEVNSPSTQVDELEEHIQLARAWMNKQVENLDPTANSIHDQTQRKAEKSKEIGQQSEPMHHRQPSPIETFSFKTTAPSIGSIDQPIQSTPKQNMLRRVKSFFNKKSKIKSENSGIGNTTKNLKRHDTRKSTRSTRSLASISVSIRSVGSRIRQRFSKKHQPAAA